MSQAARVEKCELRRKNPNKARGNNSTCASGYAPTIGLETEFNRKVEKWKHGDMGNEVRLMGNSILASIFQNLISIEF